MKETPTFRLGKAIEQEYGVETNTRGYRIASEIGDEAGMSDNLVYVTLLNMAERGLVERKQNGKDARYNLFGLSERWKDELEETHWDPVIDDE